MSVFVDTSAFLAVLDADDERAQKAWELTNIIAKSIITAKRNNFAFLPATHRQALYILIFSFFIGVCDKTQRRIITLR